MCDLISNINNYKLIHWPRTGGQSTCGFIHARSCIGYHSADAWANGTNIIIIINIIKAIYIAQDR